MHSEQIDVTNTAYAIAAELRGFADPDRDLVAMAPPAPGSPRVFIDSLLDQIIQEEPTAWPAILRVLTIASVAMPALRKLVALLNAIPADKIVEVLKKVREIV